MPRIRTIKPDFFYDTEIAELPPLIRIFFIGLWTQADREGRLADEPRKLWAQILPYDEIDADAALSQLSQRFIYRYESGGRKYIQIINFTKHQMPHYKELPSTIPPPKGHKDSGYNASPVLDKDKEAVFVRDGRKCKKCGGADRLSIDHIVPRARGGHSKPDNLQILCLKCNSSKGKKLPQYRANVKPTLSQHQPDVESTSHREGKGITDNGKGKELSAETIPARQVDKITDTSAEVPRPLTDIQRVVRAFKEAKGINADDKEWDKKFFGRFSRAAKEVLDAFDGNARAAIDYIVIRGDELDRADRPDWGLEAILRSAATDQRIKRAKTGPRMTASELDTQPSELEHKTPTRPVSARFKAITDMGSQPQNEHKDRKMGADSEPGRSRPNEITRAGEIVSDSLRRLKDSAIHSAGTTDLGSDSNAFLDDAEEFK